VGGRDDDLFAFTAYSVQQCVDACSQWNESATKNATCLAAVISSKLGVQRTQGTGANCWLKSSTARDNGNIADMTLAKLIV
jgi:hypothetical protein